MTSIIVNSGAMSGGFTLGQGDTISVFAGGIVRDVVVGGGGDEIVLAGGSAAATTISASASQEIYAGAVAYQTLVDAGGAQIVSAGGVADGALLNGLSATQTVFSGGSAEGSIIGAGAVVSVASGGAVGDAQINGGGTLVLADPSLASGVDVLLGGMIDLTGLTFTSDATANINSSTDVLTITAGSSSVALTLAGNYSNLHFTATSGRFGGTAVAVAYGSQWYGGSFVNASGAGVGAYGAEGSFAAGAAAAGQWGSAVMPASPPDISGNVGSLEILSGASVHPFADAVISGTSSVTVTLQEPGNGTLSNLAGGSYNAGTGVFVVNGMAAAITSALDGLIFTPSTSAGQSATTVLSIDLGQFNSSTVAITVASSATQIGSGVDLFGAGEQDSFFVTDNGQLGVEYAASGVAAPIYQPLVFNGAVYVPATGSTVYGGGSDFLRLGGQDVFLADPTGAITALEVNSTGDVLGNTALTSGGSAFTLAAGGSIIGAGADLLGAGGEDIFVRDAGNALSAYEFNSSGVEVAATAFTVGGAPLQLDASSKVIGVGTDFWGSAGRDIFVRTASGALGAWEFTSAGAALVAHQLDIGADAFLVDNAATAVGTGFNFWGSGNSDVFLRSSTGTISAWEFNYVGQATVGQNLTLGNGAAFALDSRSSIVGTGLDFLGATYSDIFVRLGTGQLAVDEFNPNGVETAGVVLSFTIDTAGSVIGTGLNFLGADGHDLFVRNGSGNVTAEEFNSNGSVAASQTLENSDGSAFQLPLGSTVIGASAGFLDTATSGMANRDIFVRAADNSVFAWEFNISSGQATTGEELMIGNTPLQLDASSTVIGVGTDFWSGAGRDIFVRTSSDQIDAWEFSSTGQAIKGQQLTVAGAPLLFDGGNTIVGTAVDYLGTGGSDIFVRAATGGLAVWEFNDLGVATVGQNLKLIYGAAFTLDAQSSVVGVGLNFLGTTYSDIFIRLGTGQITVNEFNPNGVETSGASLFLAGNPFTLGTASSVIGTALNFLGGNNHDLFVRDGNGKITAHEFGAGGNQTAGLAMKNSDGSGFQLALGSTIIGTNAGFLGTYASDIYGSANSDIFVRAADNSISAWEFNIATGQATASMELMIGAAPLQLDASSTVIGVGTDFWGNGGRDIFVRTSSDQIDAWEFSSTGQAIEGQQLTVAGMPFLLDGGSTIVGAALDYLGTGGSDIFVRNAAGALSVWEFNAAGVANKAEALTLSSGTPFILGSGSAIIGSGHALYGAGQELLTLSSGNVSIATFSPSGGDGFVVNVPAPGNAAVTLLESSTVIAAGADNANPLQSDFIVANSSGQSAAYGVVGFNQTTILTGVVTLTEQPVFGNTAGNYNQTTVILGTNGADTLTANTAQATLIGNGGNDVYDIGVNAGVTTILNGALASGPSSTLTFLSPAIGIDNLWFDRVNDLGAVSAAGPDLRIDVLGTSESVTINDWFGSGPFQALSEISASGAGQYLDSGLTALMSAMSSYEAAHPGFKPATAVGSISDAAVLAAVNAAWHS